MLSILTKKPRTVLGSLRVLRRFPVGGLILVAAFASVREVGTRELWKSLNSRSCFRGEYVNVEYEIW